MATATNEPFVPSGTTGQLRIGGINVVSGASVSSIVQTDWQGTITLSNASRTNQLQSSNNFASADWGLQSGATLAGGIADPAGGTAAFTLSATTANAQLFNAGTVAGGAVSQIWSLWVRRRTGTGAVTFMDPAGAWQTLTLTGTWAKISYSGINAGDFNVKLAVSGDAIDIAFGDATNGATMGRHIVTGLGATASVTDYTYTSAGAVTLGQTASGTYVWSGSGVLPTSGSGGTSQLIQTVAGAGTAAPALTGTGATTQLIQTISAAGNCASTPVTGTGAISQLIQTLAATGTCAAGTPVTGTGATRQAIQTIVGGGSGSPITTLQNADVQGLNPGALWIGFKLDLGGIGGGVYFFSANLNQMGSGVSWQGQVYTPMPIMVSGFEASSQNALPHPKLQVSNLDGLVGALVASLGDLAGAILTRKQCFVKYLDAANFSGGNPYADPTAGFQDDIWVVEQKLSETWDAITFDLVALCDAQGLQIPARPIQTSTCPNSYKNADGSGLCTYVGALTSCDRGLKTNNGCVVHFGAGVPLPFGGFPGTQVVG